MLYENIILPSTRPDLFKGLRKPINGILLFGPPGNGKTFIAKALSSECNRTFIPISSSALTGKYVGDNEKNVKSLFRVANDYSPSIIFLDEVDSILCKRSENENEAGRRLKTEFLTQLDGFNVNNQVLIICATNRPWELDDAVIRRLQLKVFVTLPDKEAILNLINMNINNDKDVKFNLSKTDINELVELL